MSQMIESFMNEVRHDPLRAQPIALEEAKGEAGDTAMLPGVHPLHAVKVRLQVSVGGACMTVGELLAARHNQVLVLDRTVEQPVDLLLEGRVIARGQLMAVEDGTFAVRITELPTPMAL